MLIRRYLFIEGPYKGTAKLSPDGADKILAEVTVESAVKERVKAYLTGKGGELALCLGECAADGGKMRLKASLKEKQIAEKGIDLAACACMVLPALQEEKEKEEEIFPNPPFSEELWVDLRGSARANKGEGRLPPFEESFGMSYGLRWRVCTFDDLPAASELVSAVLLNQGTIECVNRYGGFYFGEKEEDIKVIGIPARLGKDPMPCLPIFRYLSFLKEKNAPFGCYMIGLNGKAGVLFPAIFE